VNWTVRPISFGEFCGQEHSNIVFGVGHGEKLRTPSVVFALSDGEQTVILDTGIADPEWAMAAHGTAIERSPEQEPGRALADAGVDAEAVQTVVLSHLHWDHAANNTLFPNARFIVQRTELEYAVAPLPCHAPNYEAPTTGMTPRWLDVAARFEIIDGDKHLADGLELLFLPGHSPGLQGLVADTEAGRIGVASDCVSRFENWQGRPRREWLPSGLFVDLEVYYRSLARLEDATDYVLPSHDLAVFDQAVYPPLGGE
jgi:N-acyl homoserine lactone hydrolase